MNFLRRLFRRSTLPGSALGAGILYCSGFDLLVSADPPRKIAIAIEQRMWAGDLLDQPRSLLAMEMQATASPTRLTIQTDETRLGHACADTFRIQIAEEGAAAAEIEITENQVRSVAVIVSGSGWAADFPLISGPGNLRLEYQRLGGFAE